MATGDVHTVPHDSGWANRIEGQQGVANTSVTLAEAEGRGRAMAIAAGVDHYVHRRLDREPERHIYQRSRPSLDTVDT